MRSPFAGVGARVVAARGAAIFLGLSACRAAPHAGQSCTSYNQLYCASKDRALVCESTAGSGEPANAASPTGAWVEVPCQGPRGCERRGSAVDCDDTLASGGDPCPAGPSPDYACTPDRNRALTCKDGHFELWRSCRGPNRCRVFDRINVQCDTTLGEVGDPCGQRGSYSCSTDRGSMLVCDGSTLAVASSCRGSAGCAIERESNRVSCDDAVALEGDPCDQPRRIACSVDRKAELVCDANRYARKRACLRSECRLDGTELFCD